MKKILHWSQILRNQYGERVQKVALDIGAGCPNRTGLTQGGCIFCDERGGGSGAFIKKISLSEQIRKGVEGAQKHYKTKAIILYFQSYSATNLPIGEFAKACSEAFTIAKSLGAKVCGISVSTRPDLLPQNTLDYLCEIAEKTETWVELGVQTTDENGLKWLRRGHDLAAVENALSRLIRTNIKVCAHLIAGIPGEAEDQLTQSALWLAERGVDALKFHPLHVLRGTRLEEYYQNGSFVPLSRDAYLQKVVAALIAIPDGIIIQRLNAGVRPRYLTAPEWILDKERLEREIEERFSQALDSPNLL